MTDILAFTLAGQFAAAREYFRGVLAYQRADGLFLERYGFCDNGILLSALSQYYLLTGDRDGWQEFLPAMQRLADWAITHRNLNPNDRGTLLYGILPPGKFTADIPTPAHCYLSDAYNWKGLADFSAALARAGLADRSRAIGDAAAAYRADILASMERAQFPERELFQPGEYLEGSFAWEDRAVYLNGPLTIVPMTPVSRFLERNGGGGFYYGIVAGELLETGLLDLDSPLYRRICEFMEKRGGFLLGMTSWLWQRGIDHAYTYGYLLNQMREDHVPRVLLGFYGMLAYGMSRDTFSPGEVVPLITGTGNYGQGKYGEGVYAPAAHHHCQPHGYSNSQQLRLLRNMLVRDGGNELLLGFTVPRQWMEGAGAIEVQDAPTLWGKVSFSVRRLPDADRAEARVALAPTGPERPDAIRLRVRHPGKRAMQRMQLDGKDWSGFDPGLETITLPAACTGAEIQVFYGGEPKAGQGPQLG